MANCCKIEKTMKKPKLGRTLTMIVAEYDERLGNLHNKTELHIRDRIKYLVWVQRPSIHIKKITCKNGTWKWCGVSSRYASLKQLRCCLDEGTQLKGMYDYMADKLAELHATMNFLVQETGGFDMTFTEE